ncbi:nucleoplasmin-like [Ambystoma mexicanum]|uniref:nucleoplasmin-like n=1 Tax=Ambystoma mexicanum TaxID=8296 RepID=UPI0037E94E39
MDTLDLSSIHSKEDKLAFVSWGCELDMERRSCTFKVKDDLLEHLLFLRTISLGAEAKDELHVIAVESRSTYHGDPVPIASLRTSILPMINVNGLEFTPPVTFILKAGTGPVYICAQHLTLEEDLEEDDLDGGPFGDGLDGEDLNYPEEFSYLGRG